jgi:[protein-PII] uridylyltransferase
MAQAELRSSLPDWTATEFDAYAARFYPAYWMKTARLVS